MKDLQSNKTIQRQCLVSREILAKEDMLRFVANPENNIVFDVNHKLPGKGMWISAKKEIFEKAFEKNIFAVKNKNIKLAGLNLQTVQEQLKQHLLGLLSMANKAGLIVFGQERIADKIDKNEIFALILAKDSSQNSKKRLQSHIKKDIPEVDFFISEEMESIFSGDKISFIGLKSGKITDKFLKQSYVYKKLFEEE